MKALYLSEIDSLQIVDLDTILDKFHKDGTPSGLLKRIVRDIDAQGFSIGNQSIVGSFVFILLNLPENNILILSDEELIILKEIIKHGKDYIDQPNALVDESIEVLKKIKERINDIAEPKEKVAHEGLSKLNYPG